MNFALELNNEKLKLINGGKQGEMNINTVNFKPIQPAVTTAKNSHHVPFMNLSQSCDQLTLSTKKTQKISIPFTGIFGPPKVDKKALRELVSIMEKDSRFDEACTARNVTYDFPVIVMKKQDNELRFILGFENSKGFYEKVKAKVNTDTAVLEFKSLDGLKYKESDIKYAINYLIRNTIDYYKERM